MAHLDFEELAQELAPASELFRPLSLGLDSLNLLPKLSLLVSKRAQLGRDGVASMGRLGVCESEV